MMCLRAGNDVSHRAGQLVVPVTVTDITVGLLFQLLNVTREFEFNRSLCLMFVRFARVFGPNSSQAEVYSHCIEPLLCRVLNGQNASVFAYGPTGSGTNILVYVSISSCLIKV